MHQDGEFPTPSSPPSNPQPGASDGKPRPGSSDVEAVEDILDCGDEKSSEPEASRRRKAGGGAGTSSSGKLDESETVASLRAKLEDETRRRLEAEAVSEDLRNQLEVMKSEKDDEWVQMRVANSALEEVEGREALLAKENGELRSRLRIHVSSSASKFASRDLRLLNPTLSIVRVYRNPTPTHRLRSR